MLGAGAWLKAAGAVGVRDADLVVLNAKVYTVDPKLPQAEAFAVKNGRFMAVGNTADMKALAGKNTQILDAQRMTVAPGFIDCHNHAPGNTLLTYRPCHRPGERCVRACWKTGELFRRGIDEARP